MHYKYKKILYNFYNFIFESNEKLFGSYPACDYLNISLRHLLKDKPINREAITEIIRAIEYSDGYLHNDIINKLQKNGFTLCTRLINNY